MRAVLLLLPLLVGCYGTKVVRGPGLSPDAPVPGLMVSTILETAGSNVEEGGAVGLIQAGVDIANNAQLDNFGEAIEPAVTGWLATHGVAQTADKARLMTGKETDWAEVANDFTVLSGTWVDPDGLALRIATDTIFAGGTMRALAERVGTSDPRELFAYTTVTVHPLKEWLFVGVPRVRVSVVVHDKDGTTLLKARAWGVGKRTAFVVDRSPKSLQKGFDEAMAKLAESEVEASK